VVSAPLAPQVRVHTRLVLPLLVAGRRERGRCDGRPARMSRDIAAEWRAVQAGQAVTDGALMRLAAWCGVTRAELERAALAAERRAGAQGRAAA
jgi:hypothetical protein